jgi:hypothetical protein
MSIFVLVLIHVANFHYVQTGILDADIKVEID